MKKEWVYEFGNDRKDSKLRYDGWVAIDIRDFGLGLCTHNRLGSHSLEFSLAFLTIYVAWWKK
jgi:hypothetical protein